MAGGINTPALAAAIANAGGVGSFGFAYSTPEVIARDLQQTKKATSGPINANFFIFNDVSLPTELIQQQALKALQVLPFARDILLTIPKYPYCPDLIAQLEPVWLVKPAILTFHFGLPPDGVIERARQLGICVGITATHLSEAQAIEKAGADFIIAQGIEAGGHRGRFNEGHEDEGLSTLALTRLLAKGSGIPIVAAGAIMNGSDIKAAIDCGASAAQLGTAFLCCDEAGTSLSYREYLNTHHDSGTAFTSAFSGRPARGIQNEFMRLMEQKTTLPFPIQNTLTAPIRMAASKDQNGDYQSIWAGTAYSKIRSMPASELMSELKAELITAGSMDLKSNI